MKKPSPCQDCESRALKCHSTCSKYLAYQTINHLENSRRYKESLVEQAAGEIRHHAIKKGNKT